MKCRLNIHQLIFSLKHECKADTILGRKTGKKPSNQPDSNPLQLNRKARDQPLCFTTDAPKVISNSSFGKTVECQ